MFDRFGNLGYIFSRLVQGIFVLLGLSLLIFFLSRTVPGDPARVALGPLATTAQVEKLRESMRLDEPFFVQYWVWLTGSLFQGDLGQSHYTRRPVLDDLKGFLPATIELILFSFLISLIIGQLLGVLAGYFRNSWFDGVSRLVSYIGVATPPFAIAVFLVLIFGYLTELIPLGGRLNFLTREPARVTGLLLIDSLIAGKPGIFLEALEHLILPAMSLALAHIAQESRITRASIIETRQKDYISAHTVYGIPKRSILFKYLLKPSLIPTVAVMGLDFAFLMSNAFLVEVVFGWPGFSWYAVRAMLNKDLNAIVAVVLVIGTAFILVNLIVDIVVSFLDPRIRLQRSAS